MTALTLSEFLLARIAEDEASARSTKALFDALPFAERAAGQFTSGAGFQRPNGLGTDARVLAECESKRGAIEAAWSDHERIEGEWGFCRSREQMEARDDVPGVIAYLALPYDSHPDYREEWRP